PPSVTEQGSDAGRGSKSGLGVRAPSPDTMVESVSSSTIESSGTIGSTSEPASSISHTSSSTLTSTSSATLSSSSTGLTTDGSDSSTTLGG
ncbi:uncharacterized serine-rich protein C11G7.01-like, partial [Diaphorina citri]